MNKSESPDHPETAKTLRARAEKMLRNSSADVASMSAEEVQELVHELQVHQMELEIQNEALRNTQVQLAHSRDRYSDLYEFAPVGYLTLDTHGVIDEANLTAAKMLGVERKRLAGRKFSDFIRADSQDAWHIHRRKVFADEKTVGCELEMLSASGTQATFRLYSLAFRDGNIDWGQCRTALTDVTERNAAYKALNRLSIDLPD